MYSKHLSVAVSGLAAGGVLASWQKSKASLSFAEERQPKFPFFTSAVANNPHFKKRYKGGEDAYLMTPSQRLVGVFDGVGGWGEVEICSGKFSKWLAQKVGELFEQDHNRELTSILDEAVKANPNGGSSTIVLTKLEGYVDPRGQPSTIMRACNLGDSGYMIVRPSNSKGDQKLTKIHRSTEQQYSWNFPYQCGQNCALPGKDAQNFEHKVEHNDIVVLGTDGVFDNVFDKQIIDHCLQPHLKPTGDIKPEDAATCIASLAEALSYGKKHVSPWTANAIAYRQNREKNLGGKKDDITTIVAQVKLQH